MNRLQSLQEWTKFFRNGLIVAGAAVCLFFWNSTHSADEISVAVALPLIIFNCIPFLIRGVASILQSLQEPSQRELPLSYESPDIHEFPKEKRDLALAVAYTVLGTILGFFASIAIFL